MKHRSITRSRLLLLPTLVGTLLSGSPALALQPAEDLSPEDFLRRVEKSHPGLPMLEAAVEQARAEVVAASVWSNPALSYDREEIFVGGQGQPENFLRLELPLQLSGRRGLRVEGAELGTQAARSTARRDKAGLLFDALALYWGAAATKQTVELLGQEREALTGLTQSVRARAKAGDTSGYELDRLEVELELLEDSLANAQQEHGRWQRRLGLLLGAPGTAFDARAPGALPPSRPSPKTALAQVLEKRADYQAARMRVSQAERELAAARRGWVPDVVVTAGMRNAIISRAESWGYVAGVSLSLPVFDHGQGEAAQAQARLTRAAASVKLLEQEVASELLTAQESFARTLAQAERFQQTQLPRLERLVRRAAVSFQEGERPVFELLDAYRTARAIRLRQVELDRQVRLADLELSRALGLTPGENP